MKTRSAGRPRQRRLRKNPEEEGISLRLSSALLLDNKRGVQLGAGGGGTSLVTGATTLGTVAGPRSGCEKTRRNSASVSRKLASRDERGANITGASLMM